MVVVGYVKPLVVHGLFVLCTLHIKSTNVMVF